MALQPPDPAEQAAHRVAELLEAAARGVERAWRELVELYWRRVFALARTRLRDADMAEEITQSVFVTVAEKLSDGGYDERGRFESWLFRITMNRVRDEARRAKRQATPSDPAELTAFAPPVDPSHDGSARSDEDEFVDLRAALERLPEADREIIALRHHAGLAFSEIVAVLDEPMGTLLARHHRALKKLRAMLEQPDERRENDTNAGSEREAPKQRKAAG